MRQLPKGAAYYTVEEVAQYLRLSKMTVYRLVNTGELAARRFGRTFRITPQALENFEGMSAVDIEELEMED